MFFLIVWSLLKVIHSLLYAFNLIIQCIVPDNWEYIKMLFWTIAQDLAVLDLFFLLFCLKDMQAQMLEHSL